MFVNRDYNRTEHDDFQLNIAGKLDRTTEAVPIYMPQGTCIVGWNIQQRFS